MTASKVYLNGTLLGEYFGGFTPFSFELTSQLTDGENVLAVETGFARARGSPPPLAMRSITSYGGIYRGVSLRTTGATYLEAIRVACRDVLFIPT